MSLFSFSTTLTWFLFIGICLHQVLGGSLLLNALELSKYDGESLLRQTDLKVPQASRIENNINVASSILHNRRKRDEVGIQEWPSNGNGFPNVLTDRTGCKRPSGNTDNWICDPDEVLTQQQGDTLNTMVGDILQCTRCACDNTNLCRTSPAPYGSYSIGVAIVSNLTGIGEENQLIQEFNEALRIRVWSSIERCADGIFITLNVGGRTHHTSTSSKAREALSDKAIENINSATVQYLQRGEWFNYLNEKLQYIKEELPGCGGGGLSAGQIAGIVIGCILGVAFIVSLILCCVGFFQNWDCVVGTCGGVCIGCLLSAFQAFINALVFQCVKRMCDAMGCGDCCCADCQPFSCVDDADLGAGGGGGEF